MAYAYLFFYYYPMTKVVTATAVNAPRAMLFPNELRAIALREANRVTSSDWATRNAYPTSKGSYLIRWNDETVFVNPDGSIKRFDKDGVAL